MFCVSNVRYACSAESATTALKPRDCATSRQTSRMARSSSTIRRLRKFAPSSCAGLGALSTAVVMVNHLSTLKLELLGPELLKSLGMDLSELEPAGLKTLSWLTESGSTLSWLTHGS